MSKYLSERELKGLSKVGDLMIPGGYGMPSFSHTGCIEHVDEIMSTTLPADVKDFKLLMNVMYFLPEVFVRGILNMIANEARFPSPIGGVLRLLNIGMKGVVYSLYYSDKTGLTYAGPSVNESIGYQVHCAPDKNTSAQPE
jgi:hypothetical protein